MITERRILKGVTSNCAFLRNACELLVPFSLMVSVFCGAQAPVPEPVTDQETELGQEVYKELRAKGEIIESSPLYDTLKPIADSISLVAQSRYPHPFKFFLVHEAQPNAFAHARRERLRR